MSVCAGDDQAWRFQGFGLFEDLARDLVGVVIEASSAASWVAVPRQISRFCIQETMRRLWGLRAG
jgi:hypothetical protein